MGEPAGSRADDRLGDAASAQARSIRLRPSDNEVEPPDPAPQRSRQGLRLRGRSKHTDSAQAVSPDHVDADPMLAMVEPIGEPDAVGYDDSLSDDESSGFGELRLDLPGPFAPTWRQTLRRKRQLLVLSRRAPQLGTSAVPVLAAAWSVCVGLIGATILLLISGVPFTVHGVGVVWLAGNHVGIDTEAGTISLLPLALLFAALLPARRAGRFVAIQAGERARAVGLVAAASYAALAAAIAIGLSSLGGSVTAAWPSALLWAGAVALAGGAWGFVRESRGRWRPPPLAVAVGLTVVVPLLLGMLLMVAVGLASLGSMLEVQQRLVASPLEHMGLILLQLAYLPNLLVWAAAFVIGSGFAIGAGNRLAPFTDGQPVLPDLPVLAAVPSEVPTWTALLPLVVAATGALAALILARGSGEQPLGRRIARVGPIAAGSGVCWALLAFLSSGGVGDARLAHVGPSIATGIVAAVLVGAGGLLWAVLPTLASESRPKAADLRARVQNRNAERTPSAGASRRRG